MKTKYIFHNILFTIQQDTHRKRKQKLRQQREEIFICLGGQPRAGRPRQRSPAVFKSCHLVFVLPSMCA
jgi:hypothetical protein